MTGRDEMPASVVLKARRPLWRSPRLGVGVLLIAGSVALGTWAIERAEHGQPVLVARNDLAPGDVVAAEDVTAVEMRWAGDHSIYVIGSDPAIGAVVVSFVGSGELIPASALGEAGDVSGRPMTVAVPFGTQLDVGVLVDVWAIPASMGVSQVAEPPELLAEGVIVLGLEADSGVFASGSGQIARVLIPEETVAKVLTAQSGSGTVTVVERPGG